MSKLYGLLDALETSVMEGKKVPLSEKVILNQHEILMLIDKIRLTIKSDGEVISDSVNVKQRGQFEDLHATSVTYSEQEKRDSRTLIQQAKDDAHNIKKGSNEYADFVFANLQLTMTKVQRNLAKIQTTIDNGRDMLQDKLSDIEKGKK